MVPRSPMRHFKGRPSAFSSRKERVFRYVSVIHAAVSLQKRRLCRKLMTTDLWAVGLILQVCFTPGVKLFHEAPFLYVWTPPAASFRGRYTKKNGLTSYVHCSISYSLSKDARKCLEKYRRYRHFTAWGRRFEVAFIHPTQECAILTCDRTRSFRNHFCFQHLGRPRDSCSCVQKKTCQGISKPR